MIFDTVGVLLMTRKKAKSYIKYEIQKIEELDKKIESYGKTESHSMFLYRVFERLCACADGYLCLKVESVLYSDSTMCLEQEQ